MVAEGSGRERREPLPNHSSAGRVWRRACPEWHRSPGIVRVDRDADRLAATLSLELDHRHKHTGMHRHNLYTCTTRHLTSPLVTSRSRPCSIQLGHQAVAAHGHSDSDTALADDACSACLAPTAVRS